MVWFLCCMNKTFRPWDVDQLWLLPPSVRELVPEGHLAHLVRDTIRDSLDLSEILDQYDEERGYPHYHQAMMTALLLYGYCQGIYSSRRMARACAERVDFMAVTALQKPDFWTISDFRKRHLEALGKLFVQVLQLCRQAGLVKLGHVGLDGTKLKANASKHKAMSYGRMKTEEARLAGEIQRWFEEADRADEREDREHGPGRRGDELPDGQTSSGGCSEFGKRKRPWRPRLKRRRSPKPRKLTVRRPAASRGRSRRAFRRTRHRGISPIRRAGS